MNLGKLRSEFNNPVSDKLNSYVQTMRINQELAAMNEEIDIKKFKKFLDDIFQNNSDYEVFDKKKYLNMRPSLFEIDKKCHSPYLSSAYSYYNKKKDAYFLAIPANKNEKSILNVFFYICVQGENPYKEHITFANQLSDVKDKIEYYIASIDFMKDAPTPPKFEDLELNYRWFAYSNLKLLTEDCIKLDKCKKKNCENCNKCKDFYPMVDYTANIYKYNKLVNTFIETICKDSNNRVSVKQPKGVVQYDIGNLRFLFNLPKRVDTTTSSASVCIYSCKEKKNIEIIKPDSSMHGEELFEIYTKLILYYSMNKATILKHI